MSKKTALITSLPRSTTQILLVCATIIVGVLFKDVAFGQAFILLYAAVAIWRRIESATTLKMAIIMLVAAPVMHWTRNFVLSQTFTIYAFLLLGVAVLCALVEQYRGTHSSSAKKSVVKKSGNSSQTA